VIEPSLVEEPVLHGPPDNALIERSLTVPAAFAGIFDRHASAVHRYLARRVPWSVAEDLTGETFLIAFRQRRRYQPDQADSLPWLYGIAPNLLRRHRRTEVRLYRALVRTGVDAAEHDADRVVARAAATAATRRLAEALAKLPAGERDVLLLVAWQELGYAEVARALNIPIGTVRSRLHSARGRLRRALADLNPTPATEVD
jgi:RNA polymerase sigma-70 factor (ECF subfamily)